MNRYVRTVSLAAAVCVAALIGGAAVATAAPADQAAPVVPAHHRTVVYYQTIVDNGRYVSPLPLVDQNTGTDVVNVGAIHLNDAVGGLTLNDKNPKDASLSQAWTDLATLQSKGVAVIGMLGGAAPGTYNRLSGSNFTKYYPELKQFIVDHHLDGIDLDIEQSTNISDVTHIIDTLKSDFGSGFLITLAPVATDLQQDSPGFSGFNYKQLYNAEKQNIAWFNVQFYCGWGSLSTTTSYDRIISNGYPADKIVGGTLTDPSLCSSGYVAPATLTKTIHALNAKYPAFGGISAWEYFTANGSKTDPWKWEKQVSEALAGQ